MNEDEQIIPTGSTEPILFEAEPSESFPYHELKPVSFLTLTHLFEVSFSGITQNKTKD